MVDVLAVILNDPALRERLERYAAIASYFRGQLPPSLRNDAGIITARFLQQFVHEEQQNKRLGAVRLRLGPPVVEPRGSQGGQTVPQIPSGKQIVFLLSAADVDGLAVDASGAQVATDSPSDLVPSIRLDADGVKLVVADSPGPNQGEGDVTVTLGSAPSLTEHFQVVPGDAATIALGAGVIEDRPV